MGGPPLVEGDAMGFLSFVEQNNSSLPLDPNTLFLDEYDRLQALFPDFPSPMMKNLLLRESGRGALVYQQLTSRGWNPARKPSKRDRLARETNSLFEVSYFWGLWRP